MQWMPAMRPLALVALAMVVIASSTSPLSGSSCGAKPRLAERSDGPI